VNRTFTIGIDTGGTFTDSFVADSEGNHWAVKVPTTPHDLTVCFADAIAQSAETVGIDRVRLLRATSIIRFSSTIGTNTVLTRSGPKLGLIVTTGEEESLYGAARDGRIFQFVHPDMVVGIDEAVSPTGEVERAPDPVQVNRVVRDLLERGARILVVSLRNGAADPANEQEVLRIMDRSYPRHYLGAVPAVLSTHVAAVADDEKRTAAAVVNAYMHKKLAISLYKAEDDLRAGGFRYPLLVVTADGTVTRVAKTRALSTYQSGPAAGVQASALLSKAYGVHAAITADVGGTSTDLGVVVDGRPVLRPLVDVGGLEVSQPSVELFSLGLGGGSICRVEDGKVVVGPESAAAAPGPACFGLGGKDPTPTDAWLVLGYLDPSFYLGGRRRLLPDLARGALDDRIGGPLGLSTEEAALAIKDAAERAVVAGVEEMASRPEVRRSLGGRSIADLAMVAYGGGGGIILPSAARRISIDRVFLSEVSPVFSAFGVSTFDVEHRYDARVSVDGAVEPGPVLDRLIEAARRDIRGEGFEQSAARLAVSVRDDAGSALLEDVPVSELRDRLAKEGLSDRSVVLSLTARCDVSKAGLPAEQPAATSDPGEAVSSRRQVRSEDGWTEVPVYARDKLRSGHVMRGPCLIESGGSTHLIPEGATCSIDGFGTAVVS
jgi:N-methylhydantoinase A